MNTRIVTLIRPQRINDACGGHSSRFDAGDRLSVGDVAANEDYLIAVRAQRQGGEWVKLGPFAVVHRGAVL